MLYFEYADKYPLMIIFFAFYFFDVRLTMYFVTDIHFITWNPSNLLSNHAQVRNLTSNGIFLKGQDGWGRGRRASVMHGLTTLMVNCMLGKFYFLSYDLLTLFKINFFEKFFQEYYQSVKQLGSRSGPTFCLS